MLHVYIHQPWDDRRPGVNAWFGTEFNRNNTWFEYAKPWIDYHRRCSVMLQAGKPVADVAYFISEDAPKMTGQRKPALPLGYDFDYINADVIENRLRVEDGRFVLPDGMSYRLLVLPPSDTMRPALLKKLGELVAAGGAVLGTAPRRSPSLQNYPACDAEVKSLAAGLWGEKKIIEDTNLQAALDRLHTPPDVDLSRRHPLETSPRRRHRHLFPGKPEARAPHGDDFISREGPRPGTLVAGNRSPPASSRVQNREWPRASADSFRPHDLGLRRLPRTGGRRPDRRGHAQRTARVRLDGDAPCQPLPTCRSNCPAMRKEMSWRASINPATMPGRRPPARHVSWRSPPCLRPSNSTAPGK